MNANTAHAAAPVLSATPLRAGEGDAVLADASRGLLLVVRQGVLSADTGDSLWAVSPGQALWVPPHCLRSCLLHGTFDGWRVTVAESACSDLPGAAGARLPTGLLHEAVARASTWAEGALDAVRWRLAGVILDEIAALPLATPGLPWPMDERLVGVARAMLADLSSAESLDIQATAAGMAARTLTRNFALETGLSLADWRQRARLLRAIEWLADGRPVAMLATGLGYDNVSAFIAMFRRELGVTPARFLDQPASGNSTSIARETPP